MHDEEDISYLYEEFDKLTDGYDYNTVMVAVAAFYADLVRHVTNDSDKIRELYNMMANAAICLNEDDSNQLQATQNPPQEEATKKARQSDGNERKPSKPN